MRRLLVAACVFWIAMMRVLLASRQPELARDTKTLQADAAFDLSDIHGRRVNPPLLAP